MSLRKVILPIESSRGSGRNLLRGIANYSRQHGPWSFFWEPGGLQEVIPKLKDLNADGIIMRDSEHIEAIAKLGIPMIVVRHSYEEKPGRINIVTDSERIGKMAAEHFFERGFKNFAFCGFDHLRWSRLRCDSFSRHLSWNGFSANIYHSPINDGALSWKQEYPHLLNWLKALPKPVGLMACNDDRCQHVIQVCKDLSIFIPEELAILGVDNDELVCDLSDPPLSSLSLNFERAGFEAAALLDKLMAGQPVETQNIQVAVSHIVVRQSTDINMIEDEEVAKAVQFIRRRARQPITVDDVVREVCLSRRMLEKRFRKTLNRTILQEIRRVRTNLIAQMLVETNYSILEIALSFGFTGLEHISRYFRAEHGISLRQFRKRYGKK